MKRKKSKKLLVPDPLGLIVFDFDGVFTNNKVYVSQEGVETVICDRRDGLGIRMLKKLGIKMFILSMERNPVVMARAKKLGLDVETGCDHKESFLGDFFQRRKIDPKHVIYMGNDLNDLEAMKMVGCSVCPSDAHPKIKRIASCVLDAKGGNGAVRELAEILISKKGG